jgi:Flp pilus assembly protein TadG
MIRRTLANFRGNGGGASAVEFAILAPVYFMLVVGGLNVSLLMFTVGNLQYAVARAARCASVNTTVCTDAASTVDYANSQYLGTAGSPLFTYSNTGCGNTVSASVTFVLNSGVQQYSIPLTASACMP